MIALSVALLTLLVVQTDGHGRLINPPGRSTMWRYGFNTPKNYNDHQLSCGGYGVQFYRNGGKCGICGDPWDGPRDNEAGGRYATGTITRAYKSGDVIRVQMEITVNHGGWFEFRICRNNNPRKPATEECLNKYLLKGVDGRTRFGCPAGLGVMTFDLKLPRELTCSQCLLQWKWNTASNVGCVGSICCRGCGPQEQFYGCSDVAISPGNQNYHTHTDGSAHNANNAHNNTENVSPYPSAAFKPVLPVFTSECKAKDFWRAIKLNANEWCADVCRNGLCPLEYCDQACLM